MALVPKETNCGFTLEHKYHSTLVEKVKYTVQLARRRSKELKHSSSVVKNSTTSTSAKNAFEEQIKKEKRKKKKKNNKKKKKSPAACLTTLSSEGNPTFNRQLKKSFILCGMRSKWIKNLPISHPRWSSLVFLNKTCTPLSKMKMM